MCGGRGLAPAGPSGSAYPVEEECVLYSDEQDCVPSVPQASYPGPPKPGGFSSEKKKKKRELITCKLAVPQVSTASSVLDLNRCFPCTCASGIESETMGSNIDTCRSLSAPACLHGTE